MPTTQKIDTELTDLVEAVSDFKFNLAGDLELARQNRDKIRVLCEILNSKVDIAYRVAQHRREPSLI